ncbi:MAG TPA: BlaI/MecI/CopY family transcriptional regulator [Thermoanaerobaculia bacterium]|nr:BlaI/MecI/CopY family transcriptional regulator [Thermoanaerobaculia bacterium]
MSKNLHELTDLQLAIMKEIWSRGTATVTDVHEALIGSSALAKKTVGTMMARLEKQGFLVHYAEGREFIYEPTVTRYEVARAKMRNALDNLFGGSLPALVSHALEAKDVAEGDVERVRALIAEWEKKDRKKERRK